MSKDLNNAWDFRAVYINVTKNRRDILTIARQNKNVSVETIQPIKSILCQESTDDNLSLQSFSDQSFLENAESDDEANNQSWFHVLLTASDWIQMKPDESTPKRLKKYTWSNIIANAFQQQYNLPCSFVFKNSHINNSSEALYFLKIKGQCKSKKCGNQLKGIVDTNPHDKDFVIKIRTRNTCNDDHELLKRPLNGSERKNVGKILKRHGCETYRREIAKRGMKIGETEPSNLYSGNVLRHAKKEYIDEELGILPSDNQDIMKCIEEMSVSIPYIGTISGIGSIPFFTFYSTQQQLYAYQEYCRIMKHVSTISVDATGGIVKKLNCGRRKSGHIFLYAIVINFGNTSLGVHHMLSESHDTEQIEFWLKRWQRKGAPCPAEAVCDYSRALLSALSLAFNGCIIKDYINRCFMWAKKSKEERDLSKPVSTYVRVDVSHLINLVTRWDCFKIKRQAYLKKFFVRCVALMVDSNTIQEFEKIFVLTCCVALQTHEDARIKALFADTPKKARSILEQLISCRSVDIESVNDPEPDGNRGIPDEEVAMQ